MVQFGATLIRDLDRLPIWTSLPLVDVSTQGKAQRANGQKTHLGEKVVRENEYLSAIAAMREVVRLRWVLRSCFAGDLRGVELAQKYHCLLALFAYVRSRTATMSNGLDEGKFHMFEPRADGQSDEAAGSWRVQ